MTTYRGGPPDPLRGERIRRMAQEHHRFASHDLGMSSTDPQSTGIFRVGSLVAGGVVSWMLVLLVCRIMVDLFNL